MLTDPADLRRQRGIQVTARRLAGLRAVAGQPHITADVHCAVGSAPCLTAVDDRGFEIDEAEVIYWGRCPACASLARDDTPLPSTDTPQPRS